MLGKNWRQEEKGSTEDEMDGWHHQLDGRESEWTLGVGDGQGGLACWDSWGHKELDTTEWLNWLTDWSSDLSIKNICFCYFVKMNDGTNPSDNAVWCAEGWLAWPSVRCSMDIKWLTVNLAAEGENKLETTDNVLKYHPRQRVLMEELG